MRQDDHAGVSVVKPQTRQTLVHNFCHNTKFGCSFPDIEAKRRVVIDAKWLKEYSEEIEQLHVQIKRQREVIFREQGQNEAVNPTAMNKCRTSLDSSSLKQSRNTTESIKTKLKEGRTLSSSIQEHFDYMKGATSSEACMNDSGFEDLSVPDMQCLPYGGDVEVKAFAEMLNAPENEPERRSVIPQGEACYSMQSLASRDSGVYASDDVAELLQEDRPFFGELEVMLGGHDLPSDTCGAVEGQPVAATTGSGAGAGNKYPVWFQRFSEEDDLTVQLRSLNWDSGLCLGESSSPSTSSDAEIDGLGPREETDVCESTVEERKDHQRRQRLRNLWTLCDRLEVLSSHSRLSSGGTSEVMQLVDAFSRIDDRLQVLRYGLHSLTLQVHENRNDLRSLENRASHLLTSTATSRRRMTHLCALQKLEDRLQEEWWAAYNPNTVLLHENYIV